MLVREKNKKVSIRKQKNQQWIKSYQEEEDKLVKMNFRSRDVPESSLMPQYAGLMKKREEDSHNRKMTKIVDSVTKMKPFSFQQKEEEKLIKKQQRLPDLPEDCLYQPKANEIPGFYTQVVDREAMVQAEEEKRKEKMKLRQKELQNMAKMPSRMEEDQNRKNQKAEKIEKLRQELFEKDCKFQPSINKKVPDFKKHHKKNEKIEQKIKEKNLKSITEPEPFKVAEKGLKKISNQMMAIFAISEPPNEEDKKQGEVEKKKKFKKLNNFLERNYLPTEQKKEAKLQEQAEKNKQKLDILKKMTENKNKKAGSLMKKLTVLNSLKPKQQSTTKKGQEVKGPKQMGIFQIEQEVEGDQSALPARKVEKKVQLFRGKKGIRQQKGSQNASRLGNQQGGGIDPARETEAMKKVRKMKRQEAKKASKEEYKKEKEEEERQRKHDEAKKRLKGRFGNANKEVKKRKEQTILFKQEFVEKTEAFNAGIREMEEKIYEENEAMANQRKKLYPSNTFQNSIPVKCLNSTKN